MNQCAVFPICEKHTACSDGIGDRGFPMEESGGMFDSMDGMNPGLKIYGYASATSLNQAHRMSLSFQRSAILIMRARHAKEGFVSN